MIHIGRAGAQLGSFSEFEIRQGLKSGRFFLTDLGWKEGMENWAPLSQFTEFEPSTEPMPPLSDEESDDESATPAEVLPVGLPWDFRREIGFFKGFFQTVQLVFVKPTEAFARMIPGGSLAGPLLYNMLGAWFGTMCSATYLLLTVKSEPPPPASMGQLGALFYLSPARAMEEWRLFLFFGWAIVTISTLISSGIVHLLLKLAGGARKPFHVTLRVFCFAYGTVQLLQIIPVIGSVFSPALLVVYGVIGLAVAHQVSVWRAVTALALFLLAGFVFLLGLGVLVVSIGGTPP
jgi:hypothetical protein